jgi:ribonuclease HI
MSGENKTTWPVKTVTIYTDGACNPNPGPGGWAAILLWPQAKPQELCGAEAETSNNQMELRAVMEALKVLDGPHRVVLYTDSQYLRRGITEWLPRWEQRGWQTSSKQAVKNQDLWQALAAEAKLHHIQWQWVKGHAGHKWNERADKLARSMLPAVILPLDDTSAIHIFAAASYLGKQQSGGWGVVLHYHELIKTLNGHQIASSANRMHLTAAIQGLQAIKKPLPVHIYTNSDYLRDGITRWVKGWQRQNWITKLGKPVSNRDLWQTLISVAAHYQIRWHLVTKKDLPDLMVQAKALADEAARNMMTTVET